MINRKIKIISKEEYARLTLIQATFKIAIDKKRNVINIVTNAFIEDMEKGKDHLTGKGDIERVDRVIKKLKKAIKSMDKLSRWIDFIPLRGFN
jgi:hypothetical protein